MRKSFKAVIAALVLAFAMIVATPKPASADCIAIDPQQYSMYVVMLWMSHSPEFWEAADIHSIDELGILVLMNICT
jgi:hypothetical protein